MILSRPPRYPCRCTACGRRQNLRKHPDEYVRVPKRRCRCNTGGFRVDTYRMRHEWHRPACRCHWYSFPHAKGRGFCIHNTRLTDDDIRQREETGKWA